VDLKMAKRLKIKEENPVFLFSVVGYGETGAAIFSYESYTRADKSEFVISYKR
jgi:DNA-binding GntR family transcriptional regulator